MLKGFGIYLLVVLNFMFTSVAEAKPMYYGFWASAMNGSGKGNYIAESTAKHSNTVMIRDNNRSELLEKLRQARVHRQKVILMIETVLYPWLSSVLFPDYQRRMEAYFNAVRAYDDIIIGFYVYDEPYHKSKNIAAWKVKASEATIKRQLNDVGAYLKRRFPAKQTYVTFTEEFVGASRFATQLNPQAIEVIGVNCYFMYKACTESVVRNLVSKLNSSKTRTQKIIMTADGFSRTSPTPAVYRNGKNATVSGYSAARFLQRRIRF